MGRHGEVFVWAAKGKDLAQLGLDEKEDVFEKS